jgi:hypothetical protein
MPRTIAAVATERGMASVTSTSDRSDTEQIRAATAGRWLLIVVAVLFLGVVTPVVLTGSPLADDYHTCLRPVEDGSYGPFLRDSWRELGAVRPARFLEIAAIAGLCQHVPFGFVILIPLALKLAVALVLRGLLRDLRLPAPWPEVGAALWLLEPLGTEAALWPSALHLPLGLALALGALRLWRRGRLGWAVLATLGACLCAEQVIFAFPLAVGLVTPREQRRRAVTATVAVVVVVLAVYATWPGADFRTDVPLARRLGALFVDPEWYVIFPAAGLGLHSGLLALLWAFPFSVVVLAAGVAVGTGAGPALLAGPSGPGLEGRRVLRWGLGIAGLLLLVNLPLIVTVPRGYTPRTFTPSWLVLDVVAAVALSRVRWRRPRLAGAAAGAFAAIALLSLALSVSVRVQTAELTRASSRWLAAHVPEGGTVEVCGVPRTAVEPAPVGAFALHELHWEWATQDAVRYYTGHTLTVRRAGRYWPRACPSSPPANVTLTFAELQHLAGTH